MDKSKGTNKCDICGQEFEIQMSLKVHIASFHQNTNKEHTCEICEKVFNAQNLLMIHLSTVHDNIGDIFTCNICRNKFKHVHKWYLYKHIKTFHEGHKDCKCEYCGKSFSQAGYLKHTFTEFMKAIKIANVNIVNIVVNHFLNQPI